MNYGNGFEVRKGRMGYFGSRNSHILHSAGFEGTFDHLDEISVLHFTPFPVL